MTLKIIRLLASCFLVFSVFMVSCGGKTAEEETVKPAGQEKEASVSSDRDYPIPEVETVNCPFAIPQGVDVECGCITVPEDRSKPDGNQVKIHFAIFKSKSSNPEPDPIVYLAGGPGEHALESASLMFGERFAPLTVDRDLIIFDQRGTGYSEPALECPGLIELAYEVLDQRLESEEAIALESEATRECYENLIKRGIDLSSYNSVESAADLNDLRLALGYDEWNLFGLSYGTRLALTAMRDYPEGIRSVILNSTVPLQVDLYVEMAAGFDRALSVLYDTCADEPVAAETYPDLEKVLFETIDQLDDSPAIFTAIHPLRGEAYEVLMTGENFFNFVVSTLYSSEIIPLVPKVIFDTKAGRYDTLALLVGSNLVNMELRSTGMHYSVQCSEELPFVEQEQITAALGEYPEIGEYLEESLGLFMFDMCDYWTTSTPGGAENEPVYSDIPTLILAGEFDPITPPAWGKLAGQTLTNSYFFEFPGLGHDVLLSGNECPLDIAFEFLDNPSEEPDRTCLASIEFPGFVVLEVNLVPFSSALFGISGVVPDNWIKIAPGTCIRSSVGITSLVQQAVPGMEADDILDMMTSSLGMEETPEKVSVRTANGLDWSIYRDEIQGVMLNIALADGDGLAYLIMFTCIPDDYPYYYDELLIPAIDALVLNK